MSHQPTLNINNYNSNNRMNGNRVVNTPEREHWDYCALWLLKEIIESITKLWDLNNFDFRNLQNCFLLVIASNTMSALFTDFIASPEAVTECVPLMNVFLKFYKLYRKIPVPKSLFKEIADLRSATLLKKSLQHKCFPVNFGKVLIISFL